MAKQIPEYRPVDWVVRQFGGAAQLASRIGMTRQGIYRWLHTDGGTIPSAWHKTILQYAKEDGLDINTSDIVYGR